MRYGYHRLKSSTYGQMIRTVAFFSYTRADDRASGGLISKIREQLEQRVGANYGREVEVFQDTDDIKIGDDWRERLERALAEANYLIPVITPLFFNSSPCRDELTKFITKSKDLRRTDMILPIHFIDADVLYDEQEKSRDALVAAIERSQWADWRSHDDKIDIDRDLRHDINMLAKRLVEKLKLDDRRCTDSGDNKIGGRGFGGGGSVRPSFSYGRSKAVVIETKRKRFVTPRDGAPKTASAVAAAAATLTAKPQGAAPERPDSKDTAKPRGGRGGPRLRTLTDEQYAYQLAALKQAKKDDAARRKREAEEAKLRSEQEAQRKIEEEAKAKAEKEER